MVQGGGGSSDPPSAVSPGGPWASPSPVPRGGAGSCSLLSQHPPCSARGWGHWGALGAAPEATSPGPTGIGGGTDPGPHEHSAFMWLEREEEEGREG